MTLRQQPATAKGNFINGRWSPLAPNDHTLTLRSISPADLEDHIGDFVTSPAVIDSAVRAARGALSSWRRMAQDQRAQHLLRYRDALAARADALTVAISRSVGKPLWEARTEADALVAKVNITLQMTGQLLRDHEPEPGTLIRHRPVGVCAVLGPFNFPAHLANGHIVPALLSGNTVLFKPSERAPLVGQLLAECFEEAGFAPGVFNLVQGGAAVGQAILEHPLVDGIMFTGSTHVGQHILRVSSEFAGRMIALEMGGNNPIIVLEDANLAYAAREIAFAAYVTAGQRCTAARRVLVHQSVKQEIVERLAYSARQTVVGPPHSSESFLGPVISEQAAVEALEWAQTIAQHSECIVSHKREPGLESMGHYLRPGLYCLTDPSFSGTLASREWFSPLLVVQSFEHDEQLIAHANEGRFALAAAVFTKEKARFRQIANELDAGLVNWNRGTVGSSSKLPFGGTKDSGNHRPAGLYSAFYCADPVAELHVAEPKLGPTPQGLRVLDEVK
jgi:succinylglutamic semialdehyde dehydrogenase